MLMCDLDLLRVDCMLFLRALVVVCQYGILYPRTVALIDVEEKAQHNAGHVYV